MYFNPARHSSFQQHTLFQLFQMTRVIILSIIIITHFKFYAMTQYSSFYVQVFTFKFLQFRTLNSMTTYTYMPVMSVVAVYTMPNNTSFFTQPNFM